MKAIFKKWMVISGVSVSILLRGGAVQGQELRLDAYDLPVVSPASVPATGTFYSAAHEDWPPLPMNPYRESPELVPVYSLNIVLGVNPETPLYLLDDRMVVAAELLEASGMMTMELDEPPAPPGTGGIPIPLDLGPPGWTLGVLALLPPQFTSASTLTLSATNTESGAQYDLFSVTNIVQTRWTWLGRGAAGQTNFEVWNVPEAESYYRLGTMLDSDGDGLTDAYENLVSHSSVLTNDTDGDGLLDGWEWNNFGSFDPTGMGDYDNDGINNLAEQTNGTNPNDIQFRVRFADFFVNQTTPAGYCEVASGVPVEMAVLVNSTNLATAQWQPYTPDFNVPLGPTDGDYAVWVALRGWNPDFPPVLDFTKLTLDRVAPTLAITNPVSNVVDHPVIQLQGWADEALQSIAYDITNACGLLTNQLVLVEGQFYDTNRSDFSTNWFQAYDVPLTNGLNTLTLRAQDRAGNLATLTTNFTLDYTGKTAPTLDLLWPQDGLEIVGSDIVCRGRVSDDTATVTVQLVDANGEINNVDSLVGRDGVFYAEGLTLAAGTNYLTYTVKDGVGNETTTNITVLTSDLVLTLDPVVAGQSLVTGTIGDTNYTVYVNGVRAVKNGDGTWSAEITPIGIGGGAVVVNAVMDGLDPSLQQIVSPPKGVFVSQYHYKSHSQILGSQQFLEDETFEWVDGKGGSKDYDERYTVGTTPMEHIQENSFWPISDWPQALPEGTSTNIDIWLFRNPSTNITSYVAGIPTLNQEHCDNGWLDGTHNGWRTADTEMKLATGGFPGSRQMNLWCITATVTAYTNRNDSTGTPVPPEQIQIGSYGKLDANGELWLLLPDNDPAVVTPHTKWKNYTFTVATTKYPLGIMANDMLLSEKYVWPHRDFCVGQAIYFNVVGLPANVFDLTAKWDLPGDFVNRQPDPSCPAFFDLDQSLLSRSVAANGAITTAAWYKQDKKGAVASVTVWYRITEAGRLWTEKLTGKFNVFRPTTTFIPPSSLHGTPTLVITNGCMSLGWNASNDMSFSHNIAASPFSGEAGYTQLVMGEVQTDPDIPTMTEFGLDNGEFYRGITSVSTNPIPVFFDGPTVPFADDLSPIWQNLNFQTYLLFRPTGGPGPNIFVPLRLVTWEIESEAAPTPGGWIVVDGNPVDQPVDNVCTNFPHWTETYAGSGW